MVLKILQPSSSREKKKIEGSRIVEEKGIMGLGIPTGLREEIGSKTNKGRP